MSASAQPKRELARPLRLSLDRKQEHRLELAEAIGGEDYDSRLDECATPMSVASAAQNDWNAAASYAPSDLADREQLNGSPLIAPDSPAPVPDKELVLFDGAGEGGESSSRSLAITPSSRAGPRRVSQPAPQRPLRIGRGLSLVGLQATPGEPADQFDPELAGARTPDAALRDLDPAAGTPISVCGSDVAGAEDSPMDGSEASGGASARQKTVYSFRRPDEQQQQQQQEQQGDDAEPIPLTPSSRAVARSLQAKKTHAPMLKLAARNSQSRGKRHDLQVRTEVGEALAGEDYDSRLEECHTPRSPCNDYESECGTPCSFAPSDLDARSSCGV